VDHKNITDLANVLSPEVPLDCFHPCVIWSPKGGWQASVLTQERFNYLHSRFNYLACPYIFWFACNI